MSETTHSVGHSDMIDSLCMMTNQWGASSTYGGCSVTIAGVHFTFSRREAELFLDGLTMVKEDLAQIIRTTKPRPCWGEKQAEA